MKNKNIKNKPKKCGRWLFLHSRFSRTPPPLKATGPIAQLVEYTLRGTEGPRVRSRAATYQMVLAAPDLALRLAG